MFLKGQGCFFHVVPMFGCFPIFSTVFVERFGKFWPLQFESLQLWRPARQPPGRSCGWLNSWGKKMEILLMVQKSGVHQLRLVVYPIIYRVLYIPVDGEILRLVVYPFIPLFIGFSKF